MAIDLSTLTAREALTAIYIGYYDRAADPAGLAFWETIVDADGFDLTSITTIFASADETNDLFPFFADPSSTTPAAFITSLYLNLFNRTPDDAGRDFWVEQLQKSVDGVEGAQSVGQIITSIIEGAQAPDDAIITNKIAVALDWTDSAPADFVFDLNGDSGDSARAVIDGVDETQATVDAAMAATDAFFFVAPPVVEDNFIFMQENISEAVPGTDGTDIIFAEDGALNSGDRIDGGAGTDTLMIFNESDGVAVSPTVENVEAVVITNQSNDLNAQADNNVGGYSNDDETIEVDVEIDAGRMNGVERWETWNSRADVVIEDARDSDDTNGTFTADLTVAMVSTDPGNVDYAVYFDDPNGTPPSTDDLLSIEIIDQNNSTEYTAASAFDDDGNNLEDIQLDEFTVIYDGSPVTIVLDPAVVGSDHFGAGATYANLRDAIQLAMDATIVNGASLGADVKAVLGSAFSENIGNDNPGAPANAEVFGQRIILESISGKSLRDFGFNDIESSTLGEPADTAQAILNFVRDVDGDLITLNVELDDVGKGSMGGDALFGAMSTGRQNGDDSTSDSQGIQQFDIVVDRSSQLQTINSTNNALQVVNIENGTNTGYTNTTTATKIDANGETVSAEMNGDLVVRGNANPGIVSVLLLDDAGDPITDEDDAIAASTFGLLTPVLDASGAVVGYTDVTGNGPSGVATDSAMPGAQPQHNIFGFSDVREILASSMVGDVDITAELTSKVTEKYLMVQDTQSNGEADDRLFDYHMGTGNDEFLLNMSNLSFELAGTGSREDFDLHVDGEEGDDALTTNIGGAVKLLDDQGKDFYVFSQDNDDSWYENTVFNTAADLWIDGGAGNDVIWTHGGGDFDIFDGTGQDVVYTDNSGVQLLGSGSSPLSTLLDRAIDEHDQIDYFYGAVWAFNAEFVGGGNPTDVTGITNDNVLIGSLATATTPLSTGYAEIVVTFEGATGTATTGYSVTARIPVSEMTVTGTNVFVSDQDINQAVKNAINNDQVLSNVLEAVDGPGNALVVYSKIDGTFADNDLLIDLGNSSINGSAPAAIAADANFTASYDPATITATGKLFDATVGNTPSTVESDNTIFVAGDGESDVFVLSTSDTVDPAGQPAVSNGGNTLAASDLNGASNEVLDFVMNFGVDTVFNFDAGNGNGAVDGAEDVLDFGSIFAGAKAVVGTTTAVDITAAGATGSVDIISLALVDGADGSTANGTVEASELLAATVAGTGDGTASNHLYIVVDTTGDNGGEVWHVADGTGATDATASEVGTINLIGTDWTTLTSDNFA